jgi:hypothetical protein
MRSRSKAPGGGAVRLFLVLVTAVAGSVGIDASESPPPLEHWRDIVRQSPYWESQGVHANLTTIRRWVLAGEGYCAVEDRHILFDHRARFLGYMANAARPDANQASINARRQQLAAEGRVDAWIAGAVGRIGYPFVLACSQPDARLSDALARYTGADSRARLWGTWDGMRIGDEASPVSLHEAIRHVYEFRRGGGRISLPDHVLGTLAGKTIIESGGVREARSRAGARGVMQLSAPALADCELDERFHLHRIAQIDCALYLLEQNHRILEPVFAEHFGHLPVAKADDLYRKLLLQAYHGGIGRVRALLTDDALNGPARYFAEHHEPFTAGDIALGMVFHNLGRNQLGFASLYYVTDVDIATRAACAALDDLPGCS